jgi:hypothetical protein
MPKSRTKALRESVETRSPVQLIRDAADAMFRAATEVCHQHDRASRVHAKSAVAEEVEAAQRACAHCDEVLGQLSTAYEQTAANIHPTGEDERWWRRANALWLASKEYLRRNGGCDAASREFKEHGPGRLDTLHMEYELEASALLALRHAAEAYKKDRPAAA